MLKGITVIATFKKENNKNELFPQSKFSIKTRRESQTCSESSRELKKIVGGAQ